MIYNLISNYSSLIRENIENPLEIFLNEISLNIDGTIIIVFIMLCWPIIMHKLTFFVVSGAYKSGECPPIGALLYLTVFIVNSKILKWLVLCLGSLEIGWIVCAFLIVCLLEYIGMCKARNYILYSDGFRAL
ncbi:MAG: hypothetical protein IJO08_03100 [Clostridia bacterium]|nr:hypothetical protein [Clostridia bacterium]